MCYYCDGEMIEGEVCIGVTVGDKHSLVEMIGVECNKCGWQTVRGDQMENLMRLAGVVPLKNRPAKTTKYPICIDDLPMVR